MAAHLPRGIFPRRFGFFPFRSPLLAESRLLSFPRGTEMFHFPRFAPARLCIQRGVRRHYPPWVSPFGHRRIKAWLAAPRRFSQLPTSFFASCRLGIHRVPFVAWSSLFLLLPTPFKRRPGSSAARLIRLARPQHLPTCAYAVVKERVTLGTRRRLRRPSSPRAGPGGADRDRTDDIQLAKLALSQL